MESAEEGRGGGSQGGAGVGELGGAGGKARTLAASAMRYQLSRAAARSSAHLQASGEGGGGAEGCRCPSDQHTHNFYTTTR